MARNIHQISLRSGPFVVVHPASMPESLFESEFFGYERGAFTGAIRQKIGLFELADQGTLFIDEVGDIPPAIQTKLLRVLQEQRFIRVGGTREIYSSFRLITATNKNLWQEVQEGRFREDLFYRLNTIPVKMPALRERGDDVVLLFKKFAMDTAEKYNMPDPVELTEAAQERLKRYSWPGNVRQLKNVTEQISILSPERIITPEILSGYIPEDPVTHDIVPLNKRNEGHSFENERELLYKILFDLRNDVTELKKLVHGQRVERERSSAPQVVEQPITYYQPDITYPVAHAAKGADEFQTPEEYVEEAVSLNDVERQMIVRALEKNRGKRRKAAQELNISERTLYRKIKEYGLDKEDL